jgi:hypothetical protein
VQVQLAAIQREPDHHGSRTGRERGEQPDVPRQLSH